MLAITLGALAYMAPAALGAAAFALVTVPRCSLTHFGDDSRYWPRG